MNRLKEKYIKEIAPKIKKDFDLSSSMAVPRLKKIVINSGIGDFKDSREAVESFVEELASIAGQQPHPRRARKAIAGFKIRRGDVVGYSVTLRGDKMWSFYDKLVSIAIPRIRDFRGLNADSFDKAGNYSMGIKEHVIFPEINPNTIKGTRHLQITIVSSSDNKELNKALLDYLGMPFKKEA